LRNRIARLWIATLVVCGCVIGAAEPSLAGAEDPATAAGGAQISAAAPDGAQISAGGIAAPGNPHVQRIVCAEGCLGRQKATPGAVIKMKGESFDYVEQMVFRGAAGPMPVPVSYRDSIRVRAVVPAGAQSSKPYLIDSRGVRSNRAPRKLTIKAPPVAPPGSGVFPVRGPHDFGGPGARFGAPRSGHTHQGQDITAACGTPLVSAMTGTVQYAGYQSAAGNYIVIDNNGNETDFVYMHLAYPATVRTVYAPVAAGQQIGVVGATGDASGCHLHFEYWQGDWWGGGQPIDPLPYLQAWDATS
jgi:murein DD-endopeptidase MepM/ murein hydrolase activator NlpD